MVDRPLSAHGLRRGARLAAAVLATVGFACDARPVDPRELRWDVPQPALDSSSRDGLAPRVLLVARPDDPERTPRDASGGTLPRDEAGAWRVRCRRDVDPDLVWPVALDADAITHVRFRMGLIDDGAAPSVGEVRGGRLRWRLRGASRWTGDVPLPVPSRDGLREVEVRLADEPELRGAIEALGIDPIRGEGVIAIQGLAIHHESAPGGGPGEWIGGDGPRVELHRIRRRARPLVAGDPLVLEGRAPVWGDLLLAVGAARRRTADGRGPGAIRLHARGPRAEWTETIELASGEGWRSIRLADLGAPEGAVRIELEFVPTFGGPSFAWIATPLRWIPDEPGTSPPSVLLVTIDTLRADAAARAIDGTLPARALPALAARGTWVPAGVAAAANTVSSHASILTAVDPKDHGGLSNRHATRADLPTLADALRERGWATAAAVTVGLLDPERFPLARGFETAFVPRDGSMRAGADLLEDVVPWLRAHAGTPVFLWLHLFEPHLPYGPEARSRLDDVPPLADLLPEIREEIRRHGPPSRFEGRSIDEAAEHLREKARLYHAEVLEADARVADVLDVLEVSGAPLLVVLTGDHGESLWEDGLYGFHQGPAEAVARVPMLFAGAGVLPGKTIRAPYRHVDLAPTILGLLGLGTGPGDVVRGTDRSPELRGFAPVLEIPAFYQYREDAVVRYDEGWKEVYEVGAHGRDATIRLYRVDEDPHGRQDRADARPDRARDARSAIEAWLGERIPPATGGDESIDPELEAMLRELGYD